MELQEMKNVWASVDARLKENEMLNKRIVQEILYKKSNKSLNKLFWSDSIGIPVLLLTAPFVLHTYLNFERTSIYLDLSIIVFGIFCIVYLPYVVYRIYGLMKIDVSESIKNNLYYINRYSLLVKWEKIAVIFIILGFIPLGILAYADANADISRWLLLISTFIFIALYGYWSYNKFYSKNIQSIKKSLEELEELKEE